MQAPLKHLVFTKYNDMASNSRAHHYKNLKFHNWEIGFRVFIRITAHICLINQIPWPISSILIHAQDLRLSNWSCWVIKSSGTLCCVAGQVVPHVLKDHNAFVFIIKHTASWPFKILSTYWVSAASCHENLVLEIHILRDIFQFRMSCWSTFKRLKHYYRTQLLVAIIVLILGK